MPIQICVLAIMAAPSVIFSIFLWIGFDVLEETVALGKGVEDESLICNSVSAERS